MHTHANGVKVGDMVVNDHLSSSIRYDITQVAYSMNIVAYQVASMTAAIVS